MSIRVNGMNSQQPNAILSQIEHPLFYLFPHFPNRKYSQTSKKINNKIIVTYFLLHTLRSN